MSKTVTIPSDTKPNWECVINGTVYSYTAGSTQSVPDPVASLIENVNALHPKQAEEPGTAGQVWTKAANGAVWADLPKGQAVADATGSAPTKDQFNALLASLRGAGLIKERSGHDGGSV